MKQLLRLLALAQESREPTVASIPGILVRAVMHTLARIVLLLAGLSLLVSLALFNISLILATFSSTHKRRA